MLYELNEKPSISIVIVNWNASHYLNECINSIIKYDDSFVKQIIVVDNGSTDNSIKEIKNGTRCILIQAGENLGFGKACNLGAKHAIGKYILFLNPDAALYKKTLSILINFMEQSNNAKIGICGAQLFDESGNLGTSAARFPTLNVLAGKILGFNKFFPRFFPAHLMTAIELGESKNVDQVIGAFFLIRRNVFEQCQGFDERFFMYFEEVDLSLRAKNLGHLSYFLSEAKAFHKGGGSSENVKAARLFFSLRSRILYAKKHYSAVNYVFLIALTAVEFMLRLAQSVVRRSWSEAENTILAYCQLVGYFFRKS